MIDRIITDEFVYILLIGVVLIAAIFVGTMEPILVVQILRAVLGLAFALFIPGYCMQAAAFPGRNQLDGKERIALSFGLSLAILPSLALILDRLPWRIHLWSVTIGLMVTIAILAAVAILRRSRVALSEQYRPLEEIHFASWWTTLESGYRIAYILTALIVLAFGSIGAVILTAEKPAERLTEFYLLNEQLQAELYPREVMIGQPVVVTLGIRNLEGQDERYRVVIEDGSGVLWDTQSFFLADQGAVESPISFVPREIGEDVEVIFNLYREGQTDPYRVLRLLLEVQSAP